MGSGDCHYGDRYQADDPPKRCLWHAGEEGRSAESTTAQSGERAPSAFRWRGPPPAHAEVRALGRSRRGPPERRGQQHGEAGRLIA
jgi:hypothetical protein